MEFRAAENLESRDDTHKVVRAVAAFGDQVCGLLIAVESFRCGV